MKYWVENLDEILKSVEKKSGIALMKCWMYLEGKLKDEVKNDSYDTWQLARSITTTQVSENKVLVGTNLDYALIREYGRKPWKFPPLQALVGWTARKGMISGWATQRYEDLHYTDKGVIFIIARAIAKKWIQWKHTFERVIKREESKLSDLFVKYYG